VHKILHFVLENSKKVFKGPSPNISFSFSVNSHYCIVGLSHESWLVDLVHYHYDNFKVLEFSHFLLVCLLVY